MWNKRDLTIKGRVTVAKSLILSQITYIASSYLIESKDIHRIQSHIMRFLWRGRPPKVAKKVMWQDISLGGLKAPCVEALIKALQVTWIKRICTSRGSGWRRLLQGRIGAFDLVDVVRTQRSEYALEMWNIPMFYRIAIIEFQKINEIKFCTGDDVRKVILWNNDDICINNTSVFNKSLYGAGVKYIGQITNLNGDFFSNEVLWQKYPFVQINPLTYQGIISAIPSVWKQLLKRGGGYEEVADDGQVQFYVNGKQRLFTN